MRRKGVLQDFKFEVSQLFYARQAVDKLAKFRKNCPYTGHKGVLSSGELMPFILTSIMFEG
jgi:hypothetical protein